MVYRLAWIRPTLDSRRTVYDPTSSELCYSSRFKPSRGYKRLYIAMRKLNAIARDRRSPLRYFIVKG